MRRESRAWLLAATLALGLAACAAADPQADDEAYYEFGLYGARHARPIADEPQGARP